MTIDRALDSADLLGDVRRACQLGLIAPDGVCRSLEAKAGAAADSLGKGNSHSAHGQLGAFLKELAAQGGKHVQEPALTILREEAEALLNPPPPMPKPKQAKTGK